MNHHCCERCSNRFDTYDLLVDIKTDLTYLLCIPCAHHMIAKFDELDYVKTVITEEARQKEKNKRHIVTDKNGRQWGITFDEQAPKPSPEEMEQQRQQILQQKIDRAFLPMQDFIGMKQVKKELKNVLLQKEAKDYLKKHTNLKMSKPLMHMILSGSSGTGKTELAKQLVHIFYEAGVIQEKKITFVKAEDILGKYVGHTASQTKEKIEEATGGIFFLDEAYRLTPETAKGDQTDFGLEALETIMGAMEGDANIVFVFAGYPDKMRRFLERNEGLASRIPHVLTIQDYTESELQEMACSYLQKKGYNTTQIEDVFLEHLRQHMTNGMLKGNGRTVRNFADAVINKHMERIVSLVNLPQTEMDVLLPEDVHTAFEKEETDQERLRASFQLAKEKIQKMIGLTTVKAQLEEIGDYQYVQERRRKMGLPVQKKSHHMLFLGEPGTGKTTMARLVGELLRGSGVLSNGHFIEATKEKLTKGSSIPSTVKELIDQAKGGVLFIDEAYTLANDGKGKEALDSLIAHIENERDDLVVILAGYKTDMERLLALNEGLSSRIPYHLEFASYEADELIEIALDLFEQQQFELTKEAEQMLMALIHEAKEQDVVNGNARWVRNLFEQIQLLQSKRLVQQEMGGSVCSKEDYQQIVLQDVWDAKEKLVISVPQKQENKKEEEEEKKKLFDQLEQIEELLKTKQLI